MMDKIIVIGAGGHSKVILDIIRATNNFEIHAILDDVFSETIIKDNCIYSSTDYVNEIDKDNFYFVVAIGDNIIRRKLVDKFSIDSNRYATVIHPSAIISESTKIDVGTVIMANVVVNAATTIGKHCIINSSVVVEHDNSLGDFVHISPGTVLSGGVTVEYGSHLGSGSVVIPSKRIGSFTTIGAGAVVNKDLPDNIIAVGVPAKIIKE